jgi:hypothetical protein
MDWRELIGEMDETLNLSGKWKIDSFDERKNRMEKNGWKKLEKLCKRMIVDTIKSKKEGEK